MSHEPQIQARAAQHYAAIPATAAMDGISAAVDDAFPELFGWLAAGTSPSTSRPRSREAAMNPGAGRRRTAIAPSEGAHHEP